MKLANPFGGGIGKTGGICGAITGAMMVIGLKYGTADGSDRETNEKVYELGEKFIQEFVSRNKYLNCRELLGFDIASRRRLTEDAERVLFDLCPKYVKDAAEIIEDML